MYEQSAAQGYAGQAGAGLWIGNENGNDSAAFLHEKVEQACSVQGCAQPGRHHINGRRACGSCLELVLAAAWVEEKRHSSDAALHATPRIPLGRVLLDRGTVSEAQLAQALERQRATGAGRLGCWLKQAGHLLDGELTAALAIQWRCPVFTHDELMPAVECLPRPLMERFHVVPVLCNGRPALAFEDLLPTGLQGAMERMHGAPVSVGLLPAMEFWRATRDVLSMRAPRVAEAHASSFGTWARAAACVLAGGGPLAGRLVTIGDWCWLRFSVAGGSTRDLLCLIAAGAAPEGEPGAAEFQQIIQNMARVLDQA